MVPVIIRRVGRQWQGLFSAFFCWRVGGLLDRRAKVGEPGYTARSVTERAELRFLHFRATSGGNVCSMSDPRLRKNTLQSGA
jgi:hypothetical protein